MNLKKSDLGVINSVIFVPSNRRHLSFYNDKADFSFSFTVSRIGRVLLVYTTDSEENNHIKN